MAKKFSLELGPVQQTMLLPLLGRAEISRLLPGFFSDPKANEILDQLDFDKKLAKRYVSRAGMFGLTIRALKLDNWLREYIYNHPYCKVVNVGAGLDTAFYRVDNGLLHWYDLDLPDSMALRSQIFEAHPRVTRIAKSVFDLSWIGDVGDYSNGLIIQVPGVLMYFQYKEVRSFFEEISEKLPGADIIFDVTSHAARKVANQAVKRSGIAGTQMGWGITDAKEMESWSPHIKVVKQEPYFVNVPNWHLVPAPMRLVGKMSDIWHFVKMFHLKFVA